MATYSNTRYKTISDAGVTGSGGGSGSSVTVSDTAPTSPSEGDMWFNSTLVKTYVYYGSTWVVLNPSGTTEGSAGGTSVTAYANLATFPSSGNTTGDMAFAEDTKALYVWDGTEWDQVYSGSNQNPDWVVEPNSTYQLANDGTATTATVEATDPDGFGVTYDYDTSPSNQTQATIVNNNDGTFTITPSTNDSDAGDFVMRFKASDGLNVIGTTSTFSLAFSDDMTFAGGTQISAFTGSIDNNFSRSPYNSTADDPLKSGRWYIESSIVTYGASNFWGGIADAALNMSYGSTSQASIYENGNIYWGGSINPSLGAISSSDIIGICVDTSTREVWFARNNIWYEDPTSSSSIVIAGTGDLYYGYISGTSGSTSLSTKLHIGVNKDLRVYSPPSGFSSY